VDLVAQPGLDFFVRFIQVLSKVHQLLHLDQAQKQRQARLPCLAQGILAGVTGQNVSHVVGYKILALGQWTRPHPSYTAFLGAGDVVHKPEVTAIIGIEHGNIAVVVIHGEVSIVEVVVDQAEGIDILGQGVEFGNKLVKLFLDERQPLPIREAAIVLPLVPFWSFYRLAQRLVGFRQPVHLAEHLLPVLEILVDRDALAITVAVIGHAHPVAFDE